MTDSTGNGTLPGVATGAGAKKRVAIIGGGAAGLGAAWMLSHPENPNPCEVTMYVADDYLGGHARTVDVDVGTGKPVPTDMGVILFHPASYPNCYELFAELGVRTTPISLTLGASFDDEYWFTGGRENGRQKSTLWEQISKDCAKFETFKARLPGLTVEGLGLSSEVAAITQLLPLRDYLAGYSAQFINKALLPLLSLFVVTRTALLQMPARYAVLLTSTLSFFNPSPWFLVEGGTRSYVDALSKVLTARGVTIRLQSPVTALVLKNKELSVVVRGQAKAPKYDDVIVAVDVKAALDIMNGSDGLLEGFEAGFFSKQLRQFRYQPAKVHLHKDHRVLAPQLDFAADRDVMADGKDSIAGVRPYAEYRDDRPRVDDELGGIITYNLGAAHRVGPKTGPFVTVSSGDLTDRVIDSKLLLDPPRSWNHPVIDHSILNAVANLSGVNGSPIHFCGAYTTFPTHEAALTSGFVIAERLGAAYPFAGRALAADQLKFIRKWMFPLSGSAGSAQQVVATDQQISAPLVAVAGPIAQSALPEAPGMAVFVKLPP